MTLLPFGGVVALVIASASLSAQLPPLVRAPAARPVPTYGPVGEAMAPALRGDTAASVAALRSLVQREPRNAEAWHQLGLLLWQRAQPQRGALFIRDRTVIADLAFADTALRMAIQLAPRRAEYAVGLGRFNLQSGVSTMRLDGVQEMGRGLDLAMVEGDSGLIGMTAAELGLADWRRFTVARNRAISADGFVPNLANTVLSPRRIVPGLVLANFKRLTPPTGRVEYELALERFRLAERFAPTNLKNSRLLYMALAEGGRWPELLEVASRRARTSAFDGQARFARGLALVRMGRHTEGRAAFDSAMLTLDDDERARLFDFTRLLPPGDIMTGGATALDSATVQRLSPAHREMAARLFWAVRDPSPSDSANELELEFIARVVEAEFRWSDDDQNLRGADSDRGDIFIRYGPPDELFTFAGSTGAADTQRGLLEGATPGGAEGTYNPGTSLAASNTSLGATMVWRYGAESLFFFDVVPGFGTARLSYLDRTWVRDVQRAAPVSWRNAPVPTETTPLLARTARFRAAGDSIDLLVITRLPADSLLAQAPGSAVVSGRDVTLALRLFDDLAQVVGDTSVVIGEAPLRATPERAFTLRTTGGPRVLRADAIEPESQRASRSLTGFDATLPRGFTVSDVLLTDTREGAGMGDAQRWRDLRLPPRAGVFDRGEKVGVVWEVYDLAASAPTAGGGHRYRITLGLQPQEGRGIGALALRVRDALGRVVGQPQNERERITVSYDRNVPPRDTHVEYLALDGFAGRPGAYRLTLTVRDLVSGREVTRNTELVVR